MHRHAEEPTKSSAPLSARRRRPQVTGGYLVKSHIYAAENREGEEVIRSVVGRSRERVARRATRPRKCNLASSHGIFVVAGHAGVAVVRVCLPVFAADRVVLHVAYPPLFGLRLRIRWTRFDVTAEGIGARLLLCPRNSPSSRRTQSADVAGQYKTRQTPALAFVRRYHGNNAGG